jgi:hypothetical protein
MFKQVCLILALVVSIPAWSQVSTADGGVGLGMTDQMATPPPVNGDAYPTSVGSEKRSNYLSGGLNFITAYSDNVLGEITSTPVSDVSYSIYPTITIDKASPRLGFTSTYSPGFTLYQHTTSRNQTDQNLGLNFRYRLTPHVTATLQDYLLKTSNVFDQSGSLLAGGISGSVPGSIGIIAPVADVLTNRANVELTDQFSRHAMIGAQGTFTNQDYLNSSEALGLYDSRASGGSAFYNYRLSRNQYIGATYQYSRILSYPTNAMSEIQTNTVFGFYTIYPKPTFSLSLLGGPQHFEISQPPVPAYGSTSPTLTASMGWQGRHTNVAASYSLAISGGGGLVGAFQSNSASVSARRQLARTWTAGGSVGYATVKNVTPSSFLSTLGGGQTIAATVSLQHQLSERFQVECGYNRLRQSYVGIPVISGFPNTNREYIRLSYQFRRPLGG